MPEYQHIGLELFWQEAFKVLERILQTQAEAIRRAALLFADCIEKNGVIQVYGTGHSRALAMELAGRAGGLVPVNRIDLEDLALDAAHWPLERVRKPEIERDLEAGQAILACYRIEAPDVFLIASNSGVNAAIVEVAQRAKEHGHELVALTSLEHTLEQMLTAETIGNLLTRGIDPPIFISANVPGGIEQGEKLRQRYAGRINYRW